MENNLTEERRNEIIKAFLTYSFNDIYFKYDDLTSKEKALCSKEEFEQLMTWARA